ncbi:hypothetical protein [Daejeonella oryzae]|uniref:hypothetical protein n=1 Tax=Daejeonella oryzae TaxID=1122943 RepID=UPI0003FB0FA0|nr:hypothetical protein [Daejeonella oryzae]
MSVPNSYKAIPQLLVYGYSFADLASFICSPDNPSSQLHSNFKQRVSYGKVQIYGLGKPASGDLFNLDLPLGLCFTK